VMRDCGGLVVWFLGVVFFVVGGRGVFFFFFILNDEIVLTMT